MEHLKELRWLGEDGWIVAVCGLTIWAALAFYTVILFVAGLWIIAALTLAGSLFILWLLWDSLKIVIKINKEIRALNNEIAEIDAEIAEIRKKLGGRHE